MHKLSGSINLCLGILNSSHKVETKTKTKQKYTRSNYQTVENFFCFNRKSELKITIFHFYINNRNL